jgi:hypothetical protein
VLHHVLLPAQLETSWLPATEPGSLQQANRCEAQDQAGNINNVGYTEHVSIEPAPTTSWETPTTTHQDTAPNQHILLPLVYIPPLETEHTRIGWLAVLESGELTDTVLGDGYDLHYHVDSGTDTEQEAPLLRHESFQEELER